MFRADPEGAARPGGSSVGCSVGNRGGEPSERADAGAVCCSCCFCCSCAAVRYAVVSRVGLCSVRLRGCAVVRASVSGRGGGRFGGACGLSALSPVPHLHLRFSPNGRPLELAGRCGLQFFTCGSGFRCFLPSEVRRGLSDKFFDPLKIAYWEKFSNSSMNRKGLSKIC